MPSKDCDKPENVSHHRPGYWAVAVWLCMAGLASADDIGKVRLWPEAVVVAQTITVGDLCGLTGFDAATHERLRAVELSESPKPGGSKVIGLSVLRQALGQAGVNMARTIVHGAAQCGVRRPRTVHAPAASSAVPAAAGLARAVETVNGLRQAVAAFFERELTDYPGQVQIDFDRRSQAVLDLAGPEFRFDVRRRNGRSLGMIELEVEIFRSGESVQTVELRPIVRLVRKVVTARRPINQKAQVRPQDVQLSERTFERLEHLGVTDLRVVIAQRAKRFIPAGTLLKPSDLESVPLVNRGQLVDVVSRSGGITVVTVAKALQAGSLGDLVELRGGHGRRDRHLVGVVVGPRRVEIRDQALALGQTGNMSGGLGR